MALGEIGVNWLKFAQLEAKFGADPSQDFPVDSHWLNKNSCQLLQLFWQWLKKGSVEALRDEWSGVNFIAILRLCG